MRPCQGRDRRFDSARARKKNFCPFFCQKEVDIVGKKLKKNSKPHKIFNESKVSVILGGLIVIVVGVMVFNFFKKINRDNISNNSKKTEITEEKKAIEENKKESKETTYTVLENDSLWSISEKFYQDGFRWKEIAKTNNISNPDEIEKGTVLKIPNALIKKGDINGNGVSISGPNAITTSTYTVVSGDDLWDIAVRACGDGYKWVKIAEDNKLANPDIIHSGNVLKIQCK